MKKTILKLQFIAICAFSITAHSQATFTGLKKDYTQSMDSILTYVNKTPITTGILYDRVMSFSSLSMLKENAVITKSNYKNFLQSWSELYRSDYTPTFLSLENLKTNINANTNPNLVDIGIINTKMNYIDFGTPTTPSLNTVGGYLYNVTGINPFLEKQITVISPLRETSNSGTVTFRLLSSLMLQLSGLQIKTLVANFDATTNYNLINNYVISTTNPVVTFTTSGKKEFVFTVTFSDNTTETLKATMDVVVSNSSTAMALASPFSFPLEQDFVGANGISTTSTGNVAFQGYNETSATKGVLEYRTYYNLITNNGTAVSKINKPIIILDGYDPGDGRKIYQYSAGYNSTKSSLYELMYYDHDNNTATDKISLVEKLRSAPYGFDVTLVNFPNGADYVERNAMALVSLLSRENAKLATNGSTEKISIIGPSMGGLVSRYALAYMEKNGINHNTKLWVSFDSPHLGANIPIGAQENLYFYGYKGRQDQAKLKFDENFRSPAARQMLIEQLDGKHEASPYPTDLWSNTAPNGQNNNSPFRQQFQNNLNSNGLAGSNGYPQNLRKIALINGTTNGTKTNGEGNMFLELAAFTIIKYGQIFGTSIQTKLKVATIEDKFLSTPYSSSQTFAGKVTIKRVGGIEVQKGRVIRTNSNSRGSMDNVQGGTFNTQGIIKDEFTLALNDAVDSQEWRAYIPNHAFIPSVSSLAFKNPNFDWSTALNRNLVCDPNNKEIYFDSYFSPSKNEEHVFVSAENANWLIKELQGIPQAPSFPIQASLLTGPDLICNANTVYSFSDACKLPSTVTWSVSPNLQIVSSTSYSVTVSQISNGQGTITATFQNGQTVAKTIWVGKPSFYLDYRYFEPQPVKSKFCAVSDVPNYTLAQQGVTNVVYTTSNNVPISNWGGPYCFRETNLFCVNATATNTCGTTTITYECDFRKANANTNFYTIYPNPSNDIVNIEIRDANNIPEKRATITGELFDMMRQLKAKVEINNNKATFSVSGLNKGIYVLKIYINDKVESHQIAVE
ncbi:T9SS type A sorting domain-containing protein [Flavobacterium psychrophilum]|nr:T9SS type A sorting domain-containing protein [Flavobacterium psychrophilum]